MCTNDIFSEKTTPEKQLKAINDYRRSLCAELKAAISIYHQLDENDRARALAAVNTINHIRHQVYKQAAKYGYAKMCIDSIDICKGRCCKWHFPKNLNYLDLFITVCSISTDKQIALKNQIGVSNGKYQCPVLLENGCLLSFDSRPLVCSNAYPCFSSNFYYKFLEKQKKKIDAQRTILKKIFKGYLSNKHIEVDHQ